MTYMDEMERMETLNIRSFKKPPKVHRLGDTPVKWRPANILGEIYYLPSGLYYDSDKQKFFVKLYNPDTKGYGPKRLIHDTDGSITHQIKLALPILAKAFLDEGARKKRHATGRLYFGFDPRVFLKTAKNSSGTGYNVYVAAIERGSSDDLCRELAGNAVGFNYGDVTRALKCILVKLNWYDGLPLKKQNSIAYIKGSMIPQNSRAFDPNIPTIPSFSEMKDFVKDKLELKCET